MFLEVLLSGKSRYFLNGGLKMWKFSVFQRVDGVNSEYFAGDSTYFLQG